MTGNGLAATLPLPQHPAHVCGVDGDAAALRTLGELLDEGDVVEVFAGRVHRQRHREDAAEIHLGVPHHGKPPQVGLLALPDVGLHRRVLDDDGLAASVDHLGEVQAKRSAGLAARQPYPVGAPLTRGPQVRDDREQAGIAVHVKRVVEGNGRKLAAPVQQLEYGGDVEVHRVDLTTHRAVLGRVVPDRVQVQAKVFDALDRRSGPSQRGLLYGHPVTFPFRRSLFLATGRFVRYAN